MTPRESIALMMRVQAGDHAAYGVLYDRYHEALARYVARYIYAEDAREDVLQETWMRVWDRRHLYRPIAGFSTWLYTIARNLALTHIAREQGTYIREGGRTITLYDDDGDRFALIERTPADTPMPDAVTEAHMELERTMDAMGAMSEHQRTCVELAAAGWLYTEIADWTGLPLGTVKSRIHRCRERLRQAVRA